MKCFFNLRQVHGVVQGPVVTILEAEDDEVRGSLRQQAWDYRSFMELLDACKKTPAVPSGGPRHPAVGPEEAQFAALVLGGHAA